MIFLDWNGTPMVARLDLNGQGFEISKLDGDPTSPREKVGSIHYQTWGGTHWVATVDGDIFTHAPNGDFSKAHTDTIINYETVGGTWWTARIIPNYSFMHTPFSGTGNPVRPPTTPAKSGGIPRPTQMSQGNPPPPRIQMTCVFNASGNNIAWFDGVAFDFFNTAGQANSRWMNRDVDFSPNPLKNCEGLLTGATAVRGTTRIHVRTASLCSNLITGHQSTVINMTCPN